MNLDNRGAKEDRGRALSDEFMGKLGERGMYAPIVQMVRRDKDLDMELRAEYLNIYYKGNRILELHEDGSLSPLDKNIQKHLGTKLVHLKKKENVDQYVSRLSELKAAVTARRGESRDSLEREVEQLIIRANNLESRNNLAEYIVVDRQYAYRPSDGNKKTELWDLVAIKWPLKARGRETSQGYLALIEVKHGDNPDIKDLDNQIARYYSHLSQNDNMESICREMKQVLSQKLDLDLVSRTERQKARLRKLPLNTSLKSAEIIIYLVDYSPNSTLLNTAKAKLKRLHFAGQIRIAHGGFAMWARSLKGLHSNRPG